MNDASRIVNRPWSCCNVLRNHGLSHRGQLDQPTYLLFLNEEIPTISRGWLGHGPLRLLLATSMGARIATVLQAKLAAGAP
ncbi:MAG: hypothetical protein IPJ58_08375 [Ardenticatenia bacterium]|nr:hypothetical protein [Ardenticatenia bacterium]